MWSRPYWHAPRNIARVSPSAPWSFHEISNRVGRARRDLFRRRPTDPRPRLLRGTRGAGDRARDLAVPDRDDRVLRQDHGRREARVDPGDRVPVVVRVGVLLAARAAEAPARVRALLQRRPLLPLPLPLTMIAK